MIQSVPKPPESPLVRVFRDHEFDIVGLARFPTDDSTLVRSLSTLEVIVKNKVAAGWDADETLAKVLVAMTMVALNHGDEGSCGYWHDLSKAIKDGTGHWTELAEKSNLQALLGGSFHKALKRFGYKAPEEVGQPYVGTILFHAGIPHPALRQVLPVVIKAVRKQSSQAINLNPVQRQTLLRNNVHIQENVRRLLASDWVAAEELWNCLARVVRAWLQFEPDWELELERLPTPALDQKKVRDALKALDDNVLF